MTQEPSPQSTEAYPDIEYVVVEKQRRRPLRRIGCGVLIIVWFLILLLPLGLFILAINEEITISRGGDIPDAHEYPRLQLSLVMEVDYRGLRITDTSLHEDSNTRLCIQTNVRFLLWQGEGDPAKFCDCYTRDIAVDDWQLEATFADVCSVDGT